MSTAANDAVQAEGLKALQYLKCTEPPLYLTPSPELSKKARLASEYLFSSLNPHVPKSPFPQLLTDGFDAEQIWQQIDLQSLPLLRTLRRQVQSFEKNPQEIGKQFNIKKAIRKEDEDGVPNGLNEEIGAFESESESLDDDDENIEEEEEEEEEEEGEEDADDHEEGVNGVEDDFLKINEMQKYLEEDEAREYGLEEKNNQTKKRKTKRDTDEESSDDEEDELGSMDLDYGDEDGDAMDNARYEDFFAPQRSTQKRKSKVFGRSNDIDTDDETYDGNDDQVGSDDMDVDDEPNDGNEDQNKQSLSTYEKEREKLQSEIEELERENLEPKPWIMQGEVTAAKRPKNSALEVDLDFEHNVRPAPVITEEVTASLEELIKQRVIEGHFDDVQKPPPLPSKAPREKVELDENKSKKGLAELYEDEYAQKTGLVSKGLTFSDEQKKEASMLFKKLCVKLDALSHFHFTPKPIIEDMAIQSDVPALAMEEIAPLAVSDAAMLAPEEVFSGKGNIKEETELTKAERKRRRANKKRKFKAKASKNTAMKAQQNSSVRNNKGKEEL